MGKYTKKKFYGKKKKGLTLKKLDRKIDQLKEDIEIKCHSVEVVPALRIAGQHLFEINVIRRGTQDHQRIGDQITLKYLDINLVAEQDVLQSSTWCRIIVLCNKMNDEDATGFLLNEYCRYASTNFAAIFSVRNEKYMEKYKAYHDKVYNVQSRGTVAEYLAGDQYDKRNIVINKRIQLHNAKVHYTTDDGNRSDILDRLYLVVMIFERGNVLTYHTTNLFYADA